MKLLELLVFTIIITPVALAQATKPDLGLPQLNQITSATLSPSYSCRSADQFSHGYEGTALFVSTYSKSRNSPDLLFNGACKAEDNFEASTAGDDFSLIADLGVDVQFEQLSAHKAFNVKGVASSENYSKFSEEVKVVEGHTYAVLLNNSDKRGLLLFKVDQYVPNEKVVLRYAVKSYQVTPAGQVRSEGFDWSATNR